MSFNDIFRPLGAFTAKGDVKVLFDGIENEIIEKINNHSVIVGCAYNLRSLKVLQALQKKNKSSCIIIDKIEIHNSIEYYKSVRDYFKNKTLDIFIDDLPKNYHSIPMNLPHTKISDPIRVFGGQGNNYTKHDDSKPRLHHKFLVFCDYDVNGNIRPCSIITGSFNFSKNASLSRENSLFFDCKYTASLFYEEWARCFLLSESLDTYDENDINPEFIDESGFEELKNNLFDDHLQYESDKDEYINDMNNGAFDKY